MDWIEPLDWMDWIEPLDWMDWIEPLDWTDWIEPLYWMDWIEPLDWMDWIEPLDWTDWIELLYWMDWIKPLYWMDWIEPLDWMDWIEPLYWMTSLLMMPKRKTVAWNFSLCFQRLQVHYGRFEILNTEIITMQCYLECKLVECLLPWMRFCFRLSLEAMTSGLSRLTRNGA